MTSTATQAYLDRDTPVTAAIRPYAAGDADWPATKAALLGVEWADVPRGTPAQLMGRDGGQHIQDIAPGDAPVAGSWDELLAAQDHGLINAAQVGEVLTHLVEGGNIRVTKGGDGG